ncbi:MAG TPA: ROK family protein [Bryobacteraceae bacterium]|nr:ROK family protein [Bryobacteraceae bacterium]
MPPAIGITAAEHIAIGLVDGHQLAAPLRIHSTEPGPDSLLSMPPAEIAACFVREIQAVDSSRQACAIGVALPGIVRCGYIEESPNLRQLKGAHMGDLISNALAEAGIAAPVSIFNDADVMAAGLAATRGVLHQHIRVWTLGNGVGFGVYPGREGVWEGGHMVVSLDPRERYCGCGGQGHLEGVMGHRAMRLRFLDMEPDEIFENARLGDQRCTNFVELWHRALAAATASSIHMVGPGKFFISGFNAKHVDLALLNQYLHEMVKMSPLQGYVFEVVSGSDEIGVIGAAVNALRLALPE